MIENQDLQRAMQRNFIEYFRPFQMRPNAIWHEDEYATWVIINGAPGNFVHAANLSDDQLDAMLREFGRKTNFMRWVVYDHDQPSDLAARLLARGLKRDPHGEPCMVASLTPELSQEPIQGLEIVRVSDAAQMDDWRQATGDGFGGGYELAKAWSETYLKKGLESGNPFLHFTGYVDGVPATSGSLLLAGGIAGIYDVSTVPAFRRRGLGRAITLAMMQKARQYDVQQAYLRASAEGIRMYQSLGFETVCHENAFIWRPEDLGGSD